MLWHLLTIFLTFYIKHIAFVFFKNIITFYLFFRHAEFKLLDLSQRLITEKDKFLSRGNTIEFENVELEWSSFSYLSAKYTHGPLR